MSACVRAHTYINLIVFLTILVSLMMIETTAALPYEQDIYNKDNRHVLVFSSKHVLNDDFLVTLFWVV